MTTAYIIEVDAQKWTKFILGIYHFNQILQHLFPVVFCFLLFIFISSFLLFFCGWVLSSELLIILEWTFAFLGDVLCAPSTDQVNFGGSSYMYHKTNHSGRGTQTPKKTWFKPIIFDTFYAENLLFIEYLILLGAQFFYNF